MLEVATYSTVAMTLGLVVTRPRLGGALRLSPALAAAGGVLLLMLLGVIGPTTVASAVADLWRSFVAVASIMVMTEVALRVGLLEWATAKVEAGARSTRALFSRVFLLGVVTASVLNNDAAILLLTPLVVALVRRRYPHRPALMIPFAFAVFMAAGVAPLVVSNPMNMVVADFMGIGFNEYALKMIPIAIAGWIVAFAILGRIFRAELDAAQPTGEASSSPPATGIQRQVLGLLLAVLAAYSIIGYLGGPVWIVAASGAALALALARGRTGDGLVKLVREGVSWETLAFLLAVLVLALGLQEVGFVDRLTAHYGGGGIFEIGTTSAIGSALLNNHPMAYMNMLALEASGGGHAGVLAALVGGDLGPRLLPIGSLAGLLWLDLLRRRGVEVPLGRFVTVGVLVTLPALAVSLALLSLY